jgi:hypothetical protein
VSVRVREFRAPFRPRILFSTIVCIKYNSIRTQIPIFSKFSVFIKYIRRARRKRGSTGEEGE